jgi:hypothetical protein
MPRRAALAAAVKLRAEDDERRRPKRDSLATKLDAEGKTLAAIVRPQISRNDSSLPSFRARLSHATCLPVAVVQRGRTCSDVSFSSRNPARRQISTRYRREACRVASVLSRHENSRFDEHCGRCRRLRAEASVTAFPKVPDLGECLPAARCGCCLPYLDLGFRRRRILRPSEPLERKLRPVEHAVEFRGPSHLWCVVRIADGAVVKTHLESREHAERHIAAMATAMV